MGSSVGGSLWAAPEGTRRRTCGSSFVHLVLERSKQDAAESNILVVAPRAKATRWLLSH